MLEEKKRDIRPPGTKVTGGYESLDVGAELNSRPMQMQTVLLTTEPSSQLYLLLIYILFILTSSIWFLWH